MGEVLQWLLDEPSRTVVVAVVAGVMTLAVKMRSRGGVHRDTQRLFDGTQRAQIHSRAANRCEHKHPLWFRCREVGNQADHVYPHSRGGATSLNNAQSLCRSHNSRKSNKVPSPVYIWRLQRRRAKYFPAGQDVTIQGRRPSAIG